MSKELTLSIRLAKGEQNEVLDLKLLIRPVLFAVLVFASLFTSIWLIGFMIPLFILSSLIVSYWIIQRLRNLFDYDVELNLEDDDKVDVIREIQLFE